jgi:hypothetical protein
MCTTLSSLRIYNVVQIWLGRFVCKQVTVCPGHIWTTLYLYWYIPTKHSWSSSSSEGKYLDLPSTKRGPVSLNLIKTRNAKFRWNSLRNWKRKEPKSRCHHCTFILCILYETSVPRAIEGTGGLTTRGRRVPIEGTFQNCNG